MAGLGGLDDGRVQPVADLVGEAHRYLLDPAVASPF
jgi:hypothetical protein